MDWLSPINGQKIAVACIYATQEGSPNRGVDNESLYTVIFSHIEILQNRSFYILNTGDLNANLGDGVFGLPWNQGPPNNNGALLWDFIQYSNFTVCNKLPFAKGSFTWESLSRGLKTTLDYALCCDNLLPYVVDF